MAREQEPVSRCIYCWEEMGWVARTAEEHGWHEDCEARMNDIFVRSMVLHDSKPLQEVVARSLKGLPPLQKSRSEHVRD